MDDILIKVIKECFRKSFCSKNNDFSFDLIVFRDSEFSTLELVSIDCYYIDNKICSFNMLNIDNVHFYSCFKKYVPGYVETFSLVFDNFKKLMSEYCLSVAGGSIICCF